jgi:hypothetical protein
MLNLSFNMLLQQSPLVFKVKAKFHASHPLTTRMVTTVVPFLSNTAKTFSQIGLEVCDFSSIE